MKFTEYITDFSKFEKIVSCLYDGKMSDIVFYQKLLENIESETINKYISEFDLNQEMTEDKRVYERIKEGMRQAIPYIIYALSGAFEN
ncbi:hypothetical protein, partial [Bacillus cereus]